MRTTLGPVRSEARGCPDAAKHPPIAIALFFHSTGDFRYAPSHRARPLQRFGVLAPARPAPSHQHAPVSMLEIVEVNDIDELSRYRMVWNALFPGTPNGSFF